MKKISVLLVFLGAACTEPNPWYIGDRSDGPHDKDLGNTDHVQPPSDFMDPGTDGFTCHPGQFIRCASATVLIKCNIAGSGVQTITCFPLQCNAGLQRCTQCKPGDKPRCEGSFVVTCTGSGIAHKTYCPQGCHDGKCLGCDKKTYFRDEDGDGFGDPNQAKQECSKPPGFTEKSGDCDDKDKNAFPGQQKFFTYPTQGTKKFDYNCNGVDEKQNLYKVSCKKQTSNKCTGDGWVYQPPTCGKWGSWATCKLYNGSCYKSYSSGYKYQGCK